MNTLQTLVRGFVQKSGGLEKVEKAVEMMKGIVDHQHYLARISKSRDGSRQLIASSMLGFTLAALIERDALKNEESA